MRTGVAQQLQGYSGRGLGVKLGILSGTSAHPQGNWHLTKAVHSPTQSWIQNKQKTHKDQRVAVRRQLKEGPDRVGTVVCLASLFRIELKALHMLSKRTLPTEPHSCSRRVCLAISSHLSNFLCLSHVMLLAISLLSGPVLHAVSVRKRLEVDLGRRVLIIHLFFRLLQKRQKPLL